MLSNVVQELLPEITCSAATLTEHSHIKFLGWKDEVSKEISYGKAGRSLLNVCHVDAPSSYLWLDYSRPGKSAVLKMPDDGVEGCGRWGTVSQGSTRP